MNDFTSKLTAIIATVLLSATMIGAAVGPANGSPAVVSAARVA